MKLRLCIAAAAACLLGAPVSAQRLGVGIVLQTLPLSGAAPLAITGLDFSDAANSQYIPLF